MNCPAPLRLHLAIALISAGLAAPGAAAADDPDFLAFSLGGFDVNDNETTAQARLEYRSDLKLLWLKPFSGVMVNYDSGVYGYGGVLLDLFLGRRVVVTPSFAVGVHEQGASKNLGAAIEFLSQIEVGFRFDDRSRLSLSFDHMSNAGIDNTNPGTEALVLTYAVPFSVVLGR